VEQQITTTQPGRVKHQGTYWPAELYQPDRPIIILPGNTVSIVGIQGITLLVVPIE
jgi:membrane protein implicated in regulation of membrane protease activity